MATDKIESVTQYSRSGWSGGQVAIKLAELAVVSKFAMDAHDRGQLTSTGLERLNSLMQEINELVEGLESKRVPSALVGDAMVAAAYTAQGATS